MSERVGGSFRVLVSAVVLACALGMICALLLLGAGSLIGGALVAAVTIYLFREFWRVTARKRALLRRGYFTGRRVGMHWVYEELQSGEILAIELPLDYVGRGEYEVHVPGERDWSARMPAWARERRDEIVERLKMVFKLSQLHFDADSEPPPADG
jgi:hypothetical protein